MSNYYFNTTRKLLFCALTGSNLMLSAHFAETNSAIESLATSSVVGTVNSANYYGFVSKLPNDVEAFSADFNTHDLWVKLENSNWTAELLSQESVKNSPEIQQVLRQWNSPEGDKLREMLESALGIEFEVVLPAGATTKLLPFLNLYQDLLYAGLSSSIYDAVVIKDFKPIQDFYHKNAPEIFDKLGKCEVPPLMFVSKPKQSKHDIDEIFNVLVQLLKMRLPSTFEYESFKTTDNNEFQFLHTKAANVLPNGYLKEIFGDRPDSDKIISAINAKDLELSWGWIDDHLVVSFGSDHNHVRFSTNNTDSVLNIPEVKKITTKYAQMKPYNLCYLSKFFQEQLDSNDFFTRLINKISEERPTAFSPAQINEITTLSKNLDEISNKYFSNEYDTWTSVAYFNNGLHAELIGGKRNALFDSTKPLTLTSLADPSTFIAINSRLSKEAEKNINKFIEEFAATSLDWYTLHGRAMLPQQLQAGSAFGEMVVIPMTKQMWDSNLKLGESLDNEGVLILDFNGLIPNSANIKGKTPRMAWVMKLKDRDGISNAWKSFPTMQPLLAMAFGQSNMFVPKMTKESNVELYSLTNFEIEDYMPHFAISDQLWMTSTSSQLSKELAGKPNIESENSLGAFVKINFSSLWKFSEEWIEILKKNPEGVLSPNQAKEIQIYLPYIAPFVKLLGSAVSLEIEIGKENEKTRIGYFLDFKDLDAGVKTELAY